MKSSLLIIIHACLGMYTENHITYAFSPSRTHPRTKQHQGIGLSSSLKATVYYPDDTIEDYSMAMGQDFYTNVDSFEPSNSHLTDLLSHDPENASILARIASAFSPQGYTIDLANIRDVRCICIDDKHLEIEVMVCDDHECSSLLVPVDFPEECNLEDEECIMNNVYNLNYQGNDLIQERMNVFADEEEAQKAHEIFKLISDSDYLKPSPTALPEWWAPATSSEEISECNMMETLLNGADWQLEMRCLCKNMLQESGTADEVQLSRVKAIGPTGMILEAHVLLGGKSVDDYGGMNNIAILDVPIKFPLESMAGDATIRDHVLNIVSSVSVS